MVWQIAVSNNPESAIRLAGIKSRSYDEISVVILNLITSLWDQDHHIVGFKYKSVWNSETWNGAVRLQTYSPPIISLVFVHIWDFRRWIIFSRVLIQNKIENSIKIRAISSFYTAEFLNQLTSPIITKQVKTDWMQSVSSSSAATLATESRDFPKFLV